MTKKWAVFFIAAVIGLTIMFGLTLPDTKFDYDFDKFFKPDDETTEYFNNHRQDFGTDNDFILIAIVNKSGVFDPAFLSKIDSLTREFKTLPYVKTVISPTTLTYNIRESLTGAIFQTPVIRGDRTKDSIRVFTDPSLIGNTFSSDTSAISLVVITDSNLSKNKSDIVSEALQASLSKYSFDGIHMAGRAIAQVVYIDKIQNEFGLFMGIAMVFVVIILFVTFRSFRGVIIPMVTVLTAVVWSIGILNLSGKGVNLLLNMLPPVIFVVGMSDAVHLYSRFLEELRNGATKEVAIHQTIFDTGSAAFLTSITTAIGFASLYLTGIPVLQDFGIIVAVGVIAAFAISITLLPAWLVLTDIPHRVVTKDKGNWQRFLDKLLIPMIRYRKWVFLGTLVITIGFGFAASKLELNNFILEDLKPDEPVSQDFAFFDKNFAGVRPFELGLKLKNKDESFLSAANLENLNKIEEYLKEQYGVSAIISPVTAAKENNRMNHGGRNEYYRLPSGNDESKTQKDLNNIAKTGKLKPVLSKDQTYARISGRTIDLGAQYFSKANLDLQTFAEAEGISKTIDIEVTGTGMLVDRTNQNLVLSLGKGLAAAFLLISILMGIVFQSFKMVIIALLPNLLPLIAIGGIMAIFGIDLKMSTSIIFTIAFGIAVDDTIHFLSRYRLELLNGRSKSQALRNAYVFTGKAIILTSIILFGGFISLCFSSFQSTFYIGILVTLTLIFALAFDLTFLPALLSLRDKESE